MKKHNILTMLLSSITALFVTSAAIAADVQHTAVLGGTVASVTSVGTNVHEGDVLLTVNALAGPMPATRALTAGVVKKVMVRPGNQVQPGEVVVIVESK